MEVVGHQWWWEFRYHTDWPDANENTDRPTVRHPERRHRHRPAHPDRTCRCSVYPALGRRAAQLLGARARGQDRPHPAAREPHVVQRQGSRPLLWAVRRAVRHRARADATSTSWRSSRPTSRPGCSRSRPPAATPPAGAPAERGARPDHRRRLHRLPHDPGHRRAGRDRAEPDARGQPQHFAGGILPFTPANLTRWLHDPQEVKHGNHMMLPRPLTDDEVRTW